MKLKLNYNWNDEIGYQVRASGNVITPSGHRGIFETDFINVHNKEIITESFNVRMFICNTNITNDYIKKSNKLLSGITNNFNKPLNYDESNKFYLNENSINNSDWNFNIIKYHSSVNTHKITRSKTKASLQGVMINFTDDNGNKFVGEIVYQKEMGKTRNVDIHLDSSGKFNGGEYFIDLGSGRLFSTITDEGYWFNDSSMINFYYSNKKNTDVWMRFQGQINGDTRINGIVQAWDIIKGKVIREGTFYSDFYPIGIRCISENKVCRKYTYNNPHNPDSWPFILSYDSGTLIRSELKGSEQNNILISGRGFIKNPNNYKHKKPLIEDLYCDGLLIDDIEPPHIFMDEFTNLKALRQPQSFSLSGNRYADTIHIADKYKETQIYTCGGKDWSGCHEYLSNLIGNHPYREIFDSWFLTMSNEMYEGIQSKTIDAITFDDWIQSDHQILGEWGWFCSCNFHGLGGCGSGDWCCGAGGLGVGCQKKEKKPGSTH